MLEYSVLLLPLPSKDLNDLRHLAVECMCIFVCHFYIFFKKTADLAARLHVSFANDLPQGEGTAPLSQEIRKLSTEKLRGMPNLSTWSCSGISEILLSHENVFT